MSGLLTTPNIDRPDEVYAVLTDLHEGLDAEQSLQADARMILLLVNHIGDLSIVKEAAAIAIAPLRTPAPPAG